MDGERVQAAAALQKTAGRLAPGGFAVEAVPRLSGGASQQTWAFDRVTAGEAGVQPLLLRCPPVASGARMTGTSDLHVSAQLIGIAGAHGVHRPGQRHVLQPGNGWGERVVMDRIEGKALGRRTVRKERLAGVRRALARQCGAAMARSVARATNRLNTSTATTGAIASLKGPRRSRCARGQVTCSATCGRSRPLPRVE